jgi:ketosteroid isomerase-like protein
MSTTATAKMTTKEIAKRLKKLCDKGDFEAAQKELFAKDAVSIEPEASGGFEKETHGLDGIIEKGKKWQSMVSEVHEIEVSEPMVAGNTFAVTMRLDTTMKDKKRMDMTELCVYHVKDGKIISEQFFM